MDPREIMFGEVAPTVPIVGYVGAGAEVFPINDFEPGDGFNRAECPRGLNPATTEAVMVRGDSMLPIDDGWVVFYSREPMTGQHIIGHLCVVQLDDGRGLIKQVRRGYTAEKYNLISTNATPMEDVSIRWATRVRAILPPEMIDDADEAESADSPTA